MLFIIIDGWSLLLIIVFLNIASDLFGVYSDNLRFPEIYAIVPENEYETSCGFSTAGYYLFDASAKMIGGTILILLDYKYDLFAFLNALTFLLAAFCIFKVKTSVEIKMKKLDHIEIKSNDKTNFTKKLLLILKDFIKNKSICKIIICCIVWNGLSYSLTPIIYILIAKNKELLFFNHSLTLSIINTISLIGLILGNLIGSRLFSNLKMHKLLGYGTLLLFSTCIMLILLQKELILFFILILNFIEGSISIAN